MLNLRLYRLYYFHDHNDHIYGAGVMSRRYRLPLYATEPTWKAAKTGGKIAAEHCRRLPLCGRLVIGDLLVETFRFRMMQPDRSVLSSLREASGGFSY